MQTSNLIKYRTKNPVQKKLIDRFQNRLVIMLVGKREISYVVDVGCGEGFGLYHLKANGIGDRYLGIDASSEALRLARQVNPGFKYRKGDIYKLPFKDKSVDLVVCCEVLEHLEDPEAALSELKRVSKKYILLSVPLEPWFRLLNFARGKYLKTWGNHPEHINWWGKKSLARMMSRHVKMLRHEVSLPWQMMLVQV